MTRAWVLFALATAGAAGLPAPAPGQAPAGVPTAEGRAVWPSSVTMVELCFSEDGGKLLVSKSFGGGAPLVTVHDVTPDPKNPGGWRADFGRTLYFPLSYPDVHGDVPPSQGRRYDVSADLSPAGDTVLTSAFKTVRLWDIRKGQNGFPRSLTLDLPGQALTAFTADGTRVLTAAVIPGRARQDKVGYELRLWDAATGKPVGEPAVGILPDVRGPLSFAMSLAFAPDGASFVTAVGGRNTGAKSAQLWDAKTLQPVGDPMPIVGDIHRFGPDGKTLLAVAKSGITRWDVANRREVCRLPTPEAAKVVRDEVRDAARVRPWFAFHPDGTRVLYRHDEQVGLWDLSGDKPVEKLTLKHSSPVYWIAISQDGKRAATASGADDEVLVWSLESGKPLLRLPHHATVKAMAFSPDGRLLATADTGDVRLWKLDPRK